MEKAINIYVNLMYDSTENFLYILCTIKLNVSFQSLATESLCSSLSLLSFSSLLSLEFWIISRNMSSKAYHQYLRESG